MTGTTAEASVAAVAATPSDDDQRNELRLVMREFAKKLDMTRLQEILGEFNFVKVSDFPVERIPELVSRLKGEMAG